MYLNLGYSKLNSPAFKDSIFFLYLTMDNLSVISPSIAKEIIDALRKSIFYMRQKHYQVRHLNIIMPDWLKSELGFGESSSFYGVKINTGIDQFKIIINNSNENQVRKKVISHSIQITENGILYKSD